MNVWSKNDRKISIIRGAGANGSYRNMQMRPNVPIRIGLRWSKVTCSYQHTQPPIPLPTGGKKFSRPKIHQSRVLASQTRPESSNRWRQVPCYPAFVGANIRPRGCTQWVLVVQFGNCPSNNVYIYLYWVKI